MKNINAAIQVLPQGVEDTYKIIDKAITIIDQSGVKYRICPFESVIETNWDDALQLISSIKEEVLKYAPHALINVKLQVSANQDVAIEDKTGKYD